MALFVQESVERLHPVAVDKDQWRGFSELLMNFWIGAWSVGASPCVSAAGPSNVRRFGSQL
ncbi:hypothetical protein WL71_18565 [Burkholderia ubonensis]|uniref:Uncharacterized protein n=1 Tax=Burkholderia ubonensis TaxID=101571 RepID=A0A107FRM8_9BURK|nr:hypothetical protein WL71_18565 [Burkholderia ubonensis]KWD87858.1 hypothetical protein WL70_08160 [Burkholderia ubonensis]KWD93336.1 hypothetical protein WL73_27470 [Burkholderia ubonensis]KWD98386.1 hypothetical protein WL72_16485 [Burkholderia ubonensis]